MTDRFDLQGHRGARGLKPENTLPSFEAAFDAGVTTVETDLHLTRDDVPVLCHDPFITPRLFHRAGGNVPDPAGRPAVRALSLAELRGYQVDRNPDPARFPRQDAGLTPLASWFGAKRGVAPYAPPALADLFAFAAAYAGEPGARAGKTDEQRERASRVRFDLELKRVPFHPDYIGDRFDGTAPGVLEEQVIACVRAAGMVERTNVRSFDHRSVAFLKRLEPGLTGAVLVSGTAVWDPAQVAAAAGASLYCPDVEFLDADQVRRAHAGGIRVVPWTVNDADDWRRLLSWGVDGITTDEPGRLAELLRDQGVGF